MRRMASEIADVADVAEMPPSIPQPLQDLISGCLRSDPRKRIALHTALELLEYLKGAPQAKHSDAEEGPMCEPARTLPLAAIALE